ncbi:MAG TPA: beta-ketoacyl-[acyl-carrier-protein] synthase family protein [Deltaproteobacteria bacterium]|nr:beta-ketoacyl-[acyl-carrier-protein] synthase family protein [Deltaproteobacteria bacterium]
MAGGAGGGGVRGGRRVVVTGLGMVTALGLDVEDSWRRALAGESGVRGLELEGARLSPVRAVGSVAGEDLEAIEAAFPAAAASEGERRTLFALWAADRAIEDAGLRGGSGTERDRFGVSLASGLPVNRLEDIARWSGDGRFDCRRFASELDRLHRESMMRNDTHRPAALVAETFSLRGVNSTVTSACAAATQAIGLAMRTIERGEADVVVAGGADSMINPVGLVFFVLLGAASTSTDDPASLCRPFDRRRSGLVMGEGAGVAVLEAEEHARSRGAKIYAEAAGYASTMDAYQVTAPHPRGEGAALAMRRAVADAALEPQEIDYINAHGTGTRLNDAAETAAIKEVFGEHARRLVVSSTKSITGHLLAASGGPEFVFTCLSVARDMVHPTINLERPDPRCDLDYAADGARETTVGAALSNSFGFGGQNASVVVRKYAKA